MHSSQASARSSIVENMASALTAQSAFLNNFENVVNRRVNIQEDNVISEKAEALRFTFTLPEKTINIYAK